MKEKLKIGILLDSYDIPAWSYKMLQDIHASEAGTVQLIVKNQVVPSEPKKFLQRTFDHFNLLLYKVYCKVDEKLHLVSPDAFELKDVRDILSVDALEVCPLRTKFSDRFSPEDIDKIRKHEIDVFIRLGFRILRGEILTVAKHGVWSYHHGDSKVNRGMPAGVWEVLESWSETGVTLQMLTEDLDGGNVLMRSYALTNHISPRVSRNEYYWKALSFAPKKIQELYDLGEDEFYKRIQRLNANPEFYSNRLFTYPSNREMFAIGIKLIFRKIKSKVKWSLYFNQWILLFRLSESTAISKSFFQYKKMIPPKDRFWADPQILKRDNKYYIFIEELLFSDNKGHISVIVMNEDGTYDEPVKVLEKDYHLSYPFLFEENGEVYMIPETRENNTIELYKCIDFPFKWELEKVLIDHISASDTTILKKDGKYWLFANVVTNAGASSLDELFVFYSEDLLGSDWTHHPANPVVSDVKRARPAGKFFFYNDNLYRPSQNNSTRYGYGIQINKVISLNEEKYEEELIDSIYPNWDKNIVATHTINSVDRLTVIDALMIRKK